MTTTRLSIIALASGLLLASGCSCGSDDDPTGGDAGPQTDAPQADAPQADADSPDAAPTIGVDEIIPSAASRLADTDLLVIGFGFQEGATLILTNCDTLQEYELETAVAGDGTSLTALLVEDPTRQQGVYTVTVVNPGGDSASLLCAFSILATEPPTVTDVIPSTAWTGVPGDGINSDTLVTIRGTGFFSTPGVRWINTANPSLSYEALIVGFIDDTEISAVVPSETLGMQPGTYHVLVTNPDLLAGQWLIEDDLGEIVPGIFTITTTPPPHIDSVSPQRVTQGACTTTLLAIEGSGFDQDATAWYMAPEGTACDDSSTDANGNLLCPLVIDARDGDTAITAHFDPCPQNASYPIVVVNPDEQTAYFFSVEVRHSAAGHYEAAEPFVVGAAELDEPRWKHAATFGFDPFGSGYMYVTGGQDEERRVLDSTEISQVSIFGVPGPFFTAQQYGGADEPRVVNRLAAARQGATMVRLARDLFFLGGAEAPTDVNDAVSATQTVQRARILSFEEMAGIQLPSQQAGGELPVGSWYYRVSAIGPWGESLATREVIARQMGGSIRVCWVLPSSGLAASVNVYRSLASDGRSNTSALLATELGGNCFEDDGTGTLTPAPGRLRGRPDAGDGPGVGAYTYRVSAVIDLGGGEEYESYAGYAATIVITQEDVDDGNSAVQVVWDQIPGASYRLYRLDPGTSTFLRVDTGGDLTDESFLDDGVDFASPEASPREEIRPLPAGSLSFWDEVSPSLNSRREGLDGVVISLDPQTSGGLVGRILVAGGRTDNTGADDTYLRTAESLGVREDGSLEDEWFDEAPLFTFPRVYHALVTTQTQRDTNFPPPPEEPPGSDDPIDPGAPDAGVDEPDAGFVIFHEVSSGHTPSSAPSTISSPSQGSSSWGSRYLVRPLLASGGPLEALAPTSSGGTSSGTQTLFNLTGSEPVHVIACLGDQDRTSPNFGSVDFEACRVDDVTGHLACEVDEEPQWVIQTQAEVPVGLRSFGMDALLYFDFLYPFYGVQREVVTGSPHTRFLLENAVHMFEVHDLETAEDHLILAGNENANAKPEMPRGYFQMLRMMGHIYMIGGWIEEEGFSGPTGTVERRRQ